MAAFSEKIVESFNRRGPVLRRIEGDDLARSRRPPSTAAPSFVGPGSACDDPAGVDGRRRPLAARPDRRPETVSVERGPTRGVRSDRGLNDGVEEPGQTLEDAGLRVAEGVPRRCCDGDRTSNGGRPDSTGEDATNAPGAGRLHERSRPRTGSRDGSCSGSDCERPGGGSGRAIRRTPSCRARTRTRERRCRPPAATG